MRNKDSSRVPACVTVSIQFLSVPNTFLNPKLDLFLLTPPFVFSSFFFFFHNKTDERCTHRTGKESKLWSQLLEVKSKPWRQLRLFSGLWNTFVRRINYSLEPVGFRHLGKMAYKTKKVKSKKKGRRDRLFDIFQSSQAQTPTPPPPPPPQPNSSRSQNKSKWVHAFNEDSEETFFDNVLSQVKKGTPLTLHDANEKLPGKRGKGTRTPGRNNL